jgi:hypothetical protein
MVVAETLTGLSAFKSMFDIAKSIKNMDDAIKRNEAVADLWEQIFSAQSRYAAAVEQINELEAKLVSFEAWEAEKARYYLRDYGGGTFAYELKGAPPGAEPPHRICPTCYQDRKKGLLQSRGQDAFHREMVKCSSCDREFVLGARVERDARTRSYSPRGQNDFDIFTGR